MNLRPSGYEPDELPGCSTPRQAAPGDRASRRSEACSRCDGPCLPPRRRAAGAGRSGIPRPMGSERRSGTQGPESVDPRHRSAPGARSMGVKGHANCPGQTWQRPTLPRLRTKYHRRWSVSRPGSEWDRVQPLRHSHQVGAGQFACEKLGRDRRHRFGWAWSMRTIKPIGLLVQVSFTRYRASTPCLSTS